MPRFLEIQRAESWPAYQSFPAEEDSSDGLRGQGHAVEGGKGVFPTGCLEVNGAGDGLFAGARLTGEEHRGPRLAGEADLIGDAVQGRQTAGEQVQAVPARDLF